MRNHSNRTRSTRHARGAATATSFIRIAALLTALPVTVGPWTWANRWQAGRDRPWRRSIRRASGLILLVFVFSTAQVLVAPPSFAATADIRVHLTNNSDSVLTLAGWTLDGGCWVVEPPAKIAIDQTVDIASESCGFATGTEFRVTYSLDTGQQMSLHYSNPFLGSDTFEETAPEGYAFEAFGVIEDRTDRFGCDSPCDGIPGEWKRKGVTIDPGGGNPPQFVDLPKMGVSLDRPNVFVQLDWMEDATHNQQLRQAAIDTVINAFDQDAVTYRGATRPGITLIVDAGSKSTITPGGATWGSLSRAKKVPWTKYLLTGNGDDGFQEANFYTLLKSNFLPTGRLPIFHYAVAADRIAQDTRPSTPVDDLTSGLTPGNKLGFMVTLGGWNKGTGGTQNEETGTFMHELGHTLGLDHSGGEGNGDSVNRKPNYPSIMNYAYQTVGVFRGGVQVFDYSRDTMPDVDETTLTESGGVNLGANPSRYGTTNSCSGKDAAGKDVIFTFLQAALSPVDWDCDLVTPNGGTGFDANGDTVKGMLKGSASDWTRIKFKTGGIGAGSNAKDTVTIPSSGISAPNPELTYEQARLTRVLPLDTTLTYNGARRGDYHDPATMSATLVDPDDGNSPIQGKTISFRIGSSSSDVCFGTTDSSGTASCNIRVTQAPATYNITAEFAGDTIYKTASDSSQTFTVEREETSLTFTGPTVILAGSTSTTLSAQLLEDGANDDDGDGGSSAPDPYGQTITLTLGAQSCTVMTDATGVASCSIAGVSGETLGSKTVTATFAGDTYYEPSSDSEDVIVFAFPSKGAFVLGETTVATATPSTPVTWWSDLWWLQNSSSGGIAPDSFKGFAAKVTALPTTTPANVCGTTFLTRTGNSPPPTSGVPSYMGVIVASSVTKDRYGNITGVWGKIVVVKTDPGYSPSPGHPGTGKIVATFCP